MMMRLMTLVIRLVSVDDNEVDGIGDKVGGVNTSVLSWAWMLKKQEGHWFIWKEHRYRRSS